MMFVHGPPLLVALFAWWFSTGAILWLDRARGGSFWTHSGVAAIGAFGLAGVAITADEATARGAYTAFAATLAVWGWLEFTFLTGLITGPRTEPCPSSARGAQRFAFAASTVIYHEVALFLALVAIVALTFGHANATAAIVFGVLFVMRLSAKLNLFLGVPHFSDEFMPGRLDYLKTYFRRGPATAAFPVAMAIGAALCFVLAHAAVSEPPGSAAQTGAVVGFTIAALALVEHLFMVAPVRDSALWRWAVPAPRLDTDPGRIK
jgi:putative photosynthetic complex assembly protein 2